MEKEIEKIPAVLLEKWENDALRCGISCYEIGNFIRAREREYIESRRMKEETPAVYANSARNKLTSYGNDLALAYILQIPAVERACKIARYEMELLQKKLSEGFRSDEQRAIFLSERSRWYNHLRERMRELRISKETLAFYGLPLKSVNSFAYREV